MPCADLITSYMCDAIKNISQALHSSLVFKLCARNLNLNMGVCHVQAGVCDFLINRKSRGLRFPGACDLLLHWISMLPLHHVGFPGVTTVHTHTCPCSSLPERAIQTTTIVRPLCDMRQKFLQFIRPNYVPEIQHDVHYSVIVQIDDMRSQKIDNLGCAKSRFRLLNCI